jgi:hypothetical protein
LEDCREFAVPKSTASLPTPQTWDVIDFCNTGDYRNWQETGYVLKLFDKSVSGARKRYREFIEKGIKQGRRPESVGGGLVRSAA